MLIRLHFYAEGNVIVVSIRTIYVCTVYVRDGVCRLWVVRCGVMAVVFES